MTGNGVFRFTCQAYPYKFYAIEESTNLLDWAPLAANQAPADSILSFPITNAPSKTRAFHRWRLVE